MQRDMDNLKELNIYPSPPLQSTDLQNPSPVLSAGITQKLSELKSQANFMIDSPKLHSHRNFSFPESPISIKSSARVSRPNSLSTYMNEYLGSLQRDMEFMKEKLTIREEILAEKAREREELGGVLKNLEENLRNNKSSGCADMYWNGRRRAWSINSDDENFDTSLLVEDFSDKSAEKLTKEEICGLSMHQIVRRRESGIPGQWHCNLSQKMVPNKIMTAAGSMDSRVYNGQFSPEGNLYYSSSQDTIKVYDTSDPYNWKVQEEYQASGVHWTITAIDITKCQKYLIYSTISSTVGIICLEEDMNNAYSLFGTQSTLNLGSMMRDFGIWTVKFSGTGNELLAGTSRYTIEVYDIVKKKVVNTVNSAHDDDINTVCWANRDESQVFFTGSDDSFIKIWDRRTVGKARSCEGVLAGHREGLSHISSRGDGVHVISNGKDQCLKLWDIRKFKTQEDCRYLRNYRTGFDYRWESYPLDGQKLRMNEDSSLMTFRGHSVLTTLIRCYFSPLFSTAQRYVYTGSSTGHTCVYDTVTGKTITRLSQSHCRTGPTRDVSWHPFLPLIAATSFNGNINCFYYDGDID